MNCPFYWSKSGQLLKILAKKLMIIKYCRYSLWIKGAVLRTNKENMSNDPFCTAMFMWNYRDGGTGGNIAPSSFATLVQNYHYITSNLTVLFSSTSETWFVGTVVGHQYGWLRNSTEDSKSKRYALCKCRIFSLWNIHK